MCDSDVRNTTFSEVLLGLALIASEIPTAGEETQFHKSSGTELIISTFYPDHGSPFKAVLIAGARSFGNHGLISGISSIPSSCHRARWEI